MRDKIIEYTLTYKQYKVKVLNIGATIVEYSIDNHNICLTYEDYNTYRTNEIYIGSIVGRTAGRIRNGSTDGFNIPQNYKTIHNLHGNGLHVRFYDAKVEANKIILTYVDEEGEYPGNAHIKVIYTLNDDGLTQEIKCASDKPTLLNLTNHSYFNINGGGSILNDNLQIKCDKVAVLDNDMFVQELKDVANSAFDFNNERKIKTSFDLDDFEQFKITKFIDHPFKLNGGILYSNDKYQLEINSTSDFVVVYAGNYLDECNYKFKNENIDEYSGICFETQKIPGDVNLVDSFYSKTNFKLTKTS